MLNKEMPFEFGHLLFCSGRAKARVMHDIEWWPGVKRKLYQ